MTSVRQIMTTGVHSVELGMTLREVLESLREWNVGGAPVLRGSSIVGVVSMTDLLEFEANAPAIPTFREEQSEQGDWGDPDSWQAGEEPPVYFSDAWPEVRADLKESFDGPEGPEWDRFADHDVGEVMTRKLLTVRPDDDLRTAARVMTDAGAHRVLVVDEGRLEGLVSASDLVRAVADGVV